MEGFSFPDITRCLLIPPALFCLKAELVFCLSGFPPNIHWSLLKSQCLIPSITSSLLSRGWSISHVRPCSASLLWSPCWLLMMVILVCIKPQLDWYPVTFTASRIVNFGNANKNNFWKGERNCIQIAHRAWRKKYHLVKISCGSLTLSLKYYWTALSQTLTGENPSEPSKIPKPLFRLQVSQSAGFESIPSTWHDHWLHKKRLFSLKKMKRSFREATSCTFNTCDECSDFSRDCNCYLWKEKYSYGHTIAGSCFLSSTNCILCALLTLKGMPCTKAQDWFHCSSLHTAQE